jgi:hypothetical protein
LDTLVGEISTSDGTITEVPILDVPSHFMLGNWTLVVEKWSPPENLEDIETIATKSNATYALPELLSWPSIPGLQNTSGLGFYSTSFTRSDISIGAIINFGRVVHTLRVKIKGNLLPPFGFTSAKTDISRYLVKGENVVEALTTTVMINGLSSIVMVLKTSGARPTFGTASFTSTQVEAGLVEPVTIIPYSPIKITVLRWFSLTNNKIRKMREKNASSRTFQRMHAVRMNSLTSSYQRLNKLGVGKCCSCSIIC